MFAIRRYGIIGICMTLASTAFCSRVASAQEAPAQQTGEAWCFEMEGKPAAYIRQANGEWFFVRPDKPHNVLGEISRDGSEVVLQNKKTKLFIKLTPNRAYWRQPEQEEWTTYYAGEFGVPPEALSGRSGDSAPLAPGASGGPMKQGSLNKNMPSSPTDSGQTAGANDYRVRVAYFVPNDRQPASHWEQKIRVIVYFVDSMYRNDLIAKGLKTPGLNWEQEDGQVKVHLVRGREPADYYTNPPVYDDTKQFALVAKELRPHIGKMSESLGLVFCENYNEQPHEVLWKGIIARGAYVSARGGWGMFSSHLLKDEFCALTVPQQTQKFFDQTPVIGRRAMGHRMNSARCEFIEDGFGAVIHELGHALGLPHDLRNEDRYIMGNGFRQIRRNLTPQTPRSRLVTFSDINAQLLMSSRFLNPELDRTDDVPPTADMEILGTSPTTGQIQLRITAADSTGLRAYALFDNNAGSLVSGGPLNRETVDDKALISAKMANGMQRFTLIVTDNGGNQTRVTKQIPPER